MEGSEKHREESLTSQVGKCVCQEIEVEVAKIPPNPRLVWVKYSEESREVLIGRLKSGRGNIRVGYRGCPGDGEGQSELPPCFFWPAKKSNLNFLPESGGRVNAEPFGNLTDS